MTDLNKRIAGMALGALMFPLIVLAPAAAHAASYVFQGDPTAGVDPLGGDYAVTQNGFGFYGFDETAAQQSDDTQDVVFHSGGSGLSGATSFTLTETGSDDPISQAFGSGFTQDVPNGDGVAWNTNFIGADEVQFTAPAGDQLVTGDQFFTTVGLTNAPDADFSYTIAWSDAPISAAPEPAAWGLMILGAALAGATLRRVRRDARAGA